MIITFSGTGNSFHVANLLAQNLSDNVIPVVSTPPSEIEFSGKSLGFVFPIYSWGVPPIVLNYIRNLNDNFIKEIKNRFVWTVMVCGDETGKAPDMLRKVLREKGIELSAGWSVQAPNNYVILPGFDTDSKQLEKEKLEKLPGVCKVISEKIKNGDREYNFVEGPLAGIKTLIVYPLFRRWGIFPDRWRSTEECISCGKCAKACPVGNIKMVTDKVNGTVIPKWGKYCVSCLACYHICPRNAVQYGNATNNKHQYYYGPNR